MKLIVLSSLFSIALADIYLHSPRGSNNRLDDENRDRNNANRLFDSQNNNRGGANVGNLAYYAGSKLRVEWTSQHSCGNPNNHCEIIVQYMCDDKLRDGTTTTTIPTDPNKCYNQDCDTDVRYGRHESFEYYKDCEQRERNQGLFTSSQNLKGNKAKYTRQNPNGGRRGYECPEERDYYPYWQPTPWKDIVILSNNEQRCAAYAAESQNVKPRSYCKVSAYDIQETGNQNKFTIPIADPEKCKEITFEKEDGTTVQAEWVEAPAWGIPQPECGSNVWQRDNHHGNVEGGFFTAWNITVPDEIHDSCVMRIRYNITTKDFTHFDALTTVSSAGLDAENNKNKNEGDKNSANVDVAAMYGLEPHSRGYKLKNNPKVEIFSTAADGKMELQLAVNTAQYGRTFEDRTHRFSILPMPENLVGKKVHNVEVKGKRGNIVQTFPGTEYEFVPQRLNMKVNDDYVHFQWTGSNTNPNNNAGQGRQGSDRSNIMTMEAKRYDEPQPTDAVSLQGLETNGHWGSSYPAKLDDSVFLGLSREDRIRLALNINDPNNLRTSGEMSELDDSSTYFNMEPKQCTVKGIYHYLSTRNNNFSNRSQKGKIVCSDTSVEALRIGTNGGTLVDGELSITIAAGVHESPKTVELVKENPELYELSASGPPVWYVQGSAEGAMVDFKQMAETGALESVTYKWQDPATGEWSELDEYDCADNWCTGKVPPNTRIYSDIGPDAGLISLVVILSIGLPVGGFFAYKRYAAGKTA